MKLSYKWIKEYVDVKEGAEELAARLTMSGSEVGGIKEAGGDSVMELEITSNRPDCLNIIGLAREASAVFDRDLRLPSMELPEGAAAEGPGIKCDIQDKELCPYYSARVITGVTAGPSGKRIRERILAVGMREVNNIVDVTNFCLMETGQPMHAFDLDRIKGGSIIVRGAVKGEKIETIDGVERVLEPGMTVIADAEGPVAIAGVMGGKRAEVTETTKNVLLESAYFDPASIRRTARALGLTSDSSYRFERGVDKGMVKAASDRAASIIADEAGGKICGFYSDGEISPEEKEIRFSAEKAGRVLGIAVDAEQAEHIFDRLGMSVSTGGDGVMTVKVPGFREDIRGEIDLVEEVARIHGYDKIPPRVTRIVPQIKRKEQTRKAAEKLRGILAAAGMNEIMTYSLISEDAAGIVSGITGETVTLMNPLSEEQKVLTPQLIDGMLKSVAWNINRKNNDIGLYEIGKIYAPASVGEGFSETPALCLGMTGALRKNWREGSRPVELYDVKGILEEVFSVMKLHVSFRACCISGMDACAEVMVPGEDKKIGFIGKPGRKLADAYDITQDVFIAQIELGTLLEKTELTGHYHAVPRFPASARDVSVLCGEELAASEIEEAILSSGEDIIRSVELVDTYQGEQIPEGKKSLTYSIEYGLDIRTLKDEEIQAVHARILEELAGRFKVSFR